ncbi:MAG TPA: nucleotidyltransferase family protein, partial [Gemmatimonadales bacterium]|nr:nucleotidyltransferase family protein [Gemmatimonadales bacterium]
MSAGASTPEAGQRGADFSPHDTARAGSSDPARAPFRAEFLAALARHQEIKRELVPLLAAWHAAGIETLLYKGFFLAEFVYPTPGTRFHGDVDALIGSAHAAEALRIALSLGWRQRRSVWRVGVADGGVLFN